MAAPDLTPATNMTGAEPGGTGGREQTAVSALLGPNLAPAGRRDALACEYRARRRGIGGLALELRAGTALLAGFERWVGFAVDLSGIVYKPQCLGGRIVGVERRECFGGGIAGHEAERRQQRAGDEPALDDGPA